MSLTGCSHRGHTETENASSKYLLVPPQEHRRTTDGTSCVDCPDGVQLARRHSPAVGLEARSLSGTPSCTPTPSPQGLPQGRSDRPGSAVRRAFRRSLSKAFRPFGPLEEEPSWSSRTTASELRRTALTTFSGSTQFARTCGPRRAGPEPSPWTMRSFSSRIRTAWSTF